MLNQSLISKLNAVPGDIAIYIEDCETHEVFVKDCDNPLLAASTIKLAVMLAAFESFKRGIIDPNDVYTVKDSDKVPSCGALTYMHSGLNVTYMDLVVLMIILSDNTATNILIEKIGMPFINNTVQTYNISGIQLRRKLFDAFAQSKGLENTVSARSLALILKLILDEKAVSADASKAMLKILLNQRLNGKIPFYLHDKDIDIAHKTGEDDGISHDAGIIFAKHTIVAVFLSNNTYTPQFERFIQDTSLWLCERLSD